MRHAELACRLRDPDIVSDQQNFDIPPEPSPAGEGVALDQSHVRINEALGDGEDR